MGDQFLKIAVDVVWKPEELIRQVEQAREKSIKRGAAILRGIMRRLIRRKKGASPPGTPPHAHASGGGIKNLIFFEWDPLTKTAIVGPAISSGSAGNPAPVPKVLDQGGRTRVRLTKALRRKIGRENVIARVRPRPFTGPALAQFEKSYPDLFRGAIN